MAKMGMNPHRVKTGQIQMLFILFYGFLCGKKGTTFVKWPIECDCAGLAQHFQLRDLFLLLSFLRMRRCTTDRQFFVPNIS